MQLFRRILVGALVALAALALALVASVALDRAIGQGRLDGVTNVEIPATDASSPPVRAWLAAGPSAASPRPAVVMIHEFWGLRRDVVEKAEALAAEGYVVVAPDTFRGAATRWIPSAIWNVVSTPREQIDADLDAVFAWLAARPDVDRARIAVMGFCYGGGAALAYSLHNPGIAATGVFYGSLITDADRLAALPGPVLGVFGREDRSIPVAEVEAFEAGLERAGVPYEITVYDGVGHAFVGGMEEIRAGGAPRAAWDQLRAFLARHLGGTPVAGRSAGAALGAF